MNTRNLMPRRTSSATTQAVCVKVLCFTGRCTYRPNAELLLSISGRRLPRANKAAAAAT